MPDFTDIIARNESGSDALVPEPLSADIFQLAVTHSAALQLMRTVPMSARTQRLPVLDLLPFAYFVGSQNDTGLKQTTDMAWKNVTLVVEEIATIVPIPENYLDDAQVPIWTEAKPRMAEAVGALIDSAVLFNTGGIKPATWGTDIYTAAVASGNFIKDGFLDGTSTNSAEDFGQSVAALGDLMAQTGYEVNGFASRPGLNWRLAGLRSAQGIPLYQDLQSSPSGRGLYGYPLSMINNGAWNNVAQMLGGDWSKAIIGLRSDMSFKLFTEGVISDANGKVILNLMQQDAVAMRLTMRLAYAVANPVTILQPNKSITQRFPFGVVQT